MQDNEIYKFMKANGLTDKDQATFLNEYSNPKKAKEVFDFFKANQLTDKDETSFYDTYLKKKEPSISSATPSRLPKISEQVSPLQQGANIVSGGVLSDISKSVPETVKEEKKGRSKYDQIKGNENRFLDIGEPVKDASFGKNKAGLMVAQVPNSKPASWGMKALKVGELQGKLANILPTGKRPTQDELWAVSEIQSELAKMPQSEASLAFKKDGWDIFKKSPLLGAEFLGETVLSSLSALVEAGKRTIPTAIGMGAAAGAPIAGIGAIGGALTGMTAGMTTAGMNLSTSGKIIDALSEQGVDVTDRQSLIDAFSDENKMSKIRERGLKYGIPIAVADAISGGIAGKIVAGAAGKSLLRKTLAGFGEAGVQAVFDMGGEAGGQYLADKKINRNEVLLEGIAGTVTNIPEVVSGVAMEKIKEVSSNKKNLAKQVAILGKEVGKDDAIYNLNRDLANNVITPEQHKEGVDFVEKAVQIDDKIPQTVIGESRAKSIELIDERDRLTQELNEREEQKKGIDVAYHKALDESNKEVQKRIDEINNQLSELAKPEKNIIKPNVRTESLEYGGSKYYITDNSGNEVGSAEVSTVDDKIIIDNLFVDEKNKRKGLATSILDKIIEDFKGRNYEYIDQNDVEFSIPYKIEVGTVVSEEGQAFSNSVRKKIEEFNKNQEKGVLPKEEIQQPIEPPTQEQILDDLKNKRFVTFEYKSESEVPDVFKDKITSVSETNGVKVVRVTLAKSLADYELNKGEKAPIQKIPDENIQQPIVEQPEIAESVRVEQEPELPEGTKVVTLSGMEEGERVKAVEERKKKTTLTEKETLHNDLIDLANRVQKSRGNEKTNLQGQIRQRVRELNAKLGEEIYKYDGVSVRAKVKSKTKGERYLKIKGTTRDTSGRAIKEDAVLLFDRSPEFVQKYEELADSPNITALQVDSGNGVTMTAEQIESALQDIADGIPSVQADNLLNALEEGFNRGYFDLRGKDIGQDRVQASVEDFIGVQQEEVGQPMDEDALIEYLNDESQFSPEEDEQISEDLKNLINEYESQPQKAVIEGEVPKAKPAAEVGSPKPTQPNEKGKADGEPKADISKEPIGEAKPKQEDVEPKSPLEQQYEEASQKKGEKAQQKAKEKLISDNFDGIVAQLMTKNKIKRKC